ncbi:MAG: FHA domain-containing protein [Thermoanaerobaculales bacterium]
MRHQWRFACAACLLGATQVLAATSQVPVVFAVDTSRSLTVAELAGTGQLLQRLSDTIGVDTPGGAVTFDDAARWLAPVGAPLSRASEALRGIKPAGHFTVLRDALFLVATQLSAGGVIVLVTDGRDENSAATVEDVAQVCSRHGVRIVAAPIGRLVDERALRRLALITGGSYLGKGAGIAPLTQAVQAAQQATAAHLAEAKPVATATPAPPPPTPIAPRPEPAARSASNLLLPAAVGALVIAAVAVGVYLLRRRPATRVCPRCGSVLAPWETECSTCMIREAQAHQAEAKPAAVAAAEEAELPPEVFDRAPLQDQLDKTFTLQDQQMLTVREPEKPPRSYFLPAEGPFSVGRAAGVNSLVLNDPTLSAQHFKIVPKDGDHFIVDLRTTNGTVVNGEKIRARKLHPGDVIRAGQVEFEYRIQYRRVT